MSNQYGPSWMHSSKNWFSRNSEDPPPAENNTECLSLHGNASVFTKIYLNARMEEAVTDPSCAWLDKMATNRIGRINHELHITRTWLHAIRKLNTRLFGGGCKSWKKIAIAYKGNELKEIHRVQSRVHGKRSPPQCFPPISTFPNKSST